MIGPVGVDHADLRQGGITVLAGKVVPAEGQVVVIHGQAVLADERIHRLGIHGGKAGQGLHVIRGGIVLLKGFLFLQVGLPGFHRVNHMLLHPLQLLRGKVPVQQVNPCAAHSGTAALPHQLNAFLTGGGTLIVLPGKEFHPEHGVGILRQAGVGHIHLRLGEDHRQAPAIQLLLHPFHVVAVQEAETGDGFDLQNMADLPQQLLGFHGIGGFLLHINALYAHAFSSVPSSEASPR